MNCSNHNMIFVKRFKSNGGKLLNKQCLNCGEHDTKAYPLNECYNFDLLPLFNSELKEEKLNQERQEHFRKYQEELKQKQELHKQYLNSFEWKQKRLQVLKRDSYLCQGCLTNSATDVHHLTYDNWGNELLFQLISVCRQCHINIHPDKQ